MLDFDSDKTSHKKTLCCRINDKHKALLLFSVFIGAGYIAVLLFGIMTSNLLVSLTVLTLPAAVNVYRLMKRYIENNKFVPDIKWWHLPLDNWDAVRAEGTETFYFVLFQARNLMIWFSLLCVVAILLYS